MTPEREREIRAKHVARAPHVYATLGRDDVEALLAEVDRLRALPVIATCGACGHRLPSFCDHPSLVLVPKGRRDIDFSAEPPTWCPLRGAR